MEEYRMRDYLNHFFIEFAYPKEAAWVLMKQYERINAQQHLEKEIEQILSEYENDKFCEYAVLINRMKEISEKAGIHEFEGNILLLAGMARRLKAYYQQEDLDERIWFQSMSDLKYKVLECKDVFGIWGLARPLWFEGFFNMTRFGLNRLQFELVPLRLPYQKEGFSLQEGMQVINVHIPRSGIRLYKEIVDASYKEAALFFKERYGLEQIVFVCDSWLLYPKNLEVLSPGSNLYSFITDYDIVQWGEYQDYEQVWRLFDKNYESDVDKLPQDTSLRKAYADWIRLGKKTGWGYGVKVYAE